MEKNIFIFGVPGTPRSHFRPCDSLRSAANSCGASHSASLSATHLRKHVATSVQLLDMAENERELLNAFMGHT